VINRYLVGLLSSNRRKQSNQVPVDYSSVFPTPDNDLHLESSSATALLGVNIPALKKKEEYDEYRDMHYRCITLHNNWGIKTLQNTAIYS
jgi:hypothetical protein